jgi:hypothetical protein
MIALASSQKKKKTRTRIRIKPLIPNKLEELTNKLGSQKNKKKEKISQLSCFFNLFRI